MTTTATREIRCPRCGKRIAEGLVGLLAIRCRSKICQNRIVVIDKRPK